MLDDFRQQADTASFEEEQEQPVMAGPAGPDPFARFSFLEGNVMGLTPFQRFVISAMLLVLTVLLGALGLLLTGKVMP